LYVVFYGCDVGLLHTGKNIGWWSSRTGCWGMYVCLRWMRY